MQNKQSKRILFLPYTYTLGGGSEKILHTILKSLDKSKYAPFLLECSHFKNFKNDVKGLRLLSPIIDFTRIDFVHYFSKIILILTKYFPLLGKLLVPADSFDVAISFNYQYPSFLLCNVKANKKIAWVHGSIEDLDYSLEKGFAMLKTYISYIAQERVFKSVDKIVVISNKTFDSVVKLYPFCLDKIEFIPNGLDLHMIQSMSKEYIVKKKADFQLIFVGRLDANKNVLFLIEVLARLLNKGEDVSMIILGEGSMLHSLQKKALELNVERNISFLGYVNNPYPYILSSDLVCLASYAEGLPTVLIEGLALGIPFISSDVGGVKELSAGGTCGFVSELDIDIYSKYIFLYSKDANRQDEMRKMAKIMSLNYDIKKQITVIDKLLRG